uniref:Egal-1 winged helix domain-containing protein n=1 Tax=Schistocephalus solidus TaxID=70667 RepID=A0A0X3NUE4_SCHSO
MTSGEGKIGSTGCSLNNLPRTGMMMLGNGVAEQNYPKALLLLEILLNHRGPLPIHALYVASFAHMNGMHDPYAFSIPINSVSLAEFIEFLQMFPSLFVIAGNYVYPAGTLDVDQSPVWVSSKYAGMDSFCPCLNPSILDPPSQISLLSDPVLRQNTVAFLQNYLLSCGPHRFVPIQRLMDCLSYVTPITHALFPNIKSLSSFLRQYPDVFHLKDGSVGLSKSKRNSHHKHQNEDRGNYASASPNDQCVFPNGILKVEVLLSSSTDFTNAMSCILPASEFSVILVLRRILRPAFSNGLHVALVIKELIAFPYDMKKIIGLTRFELHAFLDKYKQFFDILCPSTEDQFAGEVEPENGKMHHRIPTSFCVRINANAWNMQSRLLDSRPELSNSKDPSRLSQHVGRVFRVAKSWGIIDLGNHVHVFFDKSIFRNVFDLQKVFQPNELVYFDAIRAPLRSRAKWRATRVWKPDDHDILQHVQSPKQTSEDDDVTVTCLPFLLPSGRGRRASSGYKTSVESMPTVMHYSSSSTSRPKLATRLRRCHSLERFSSAQTAVSAVAGSTRTGKQFDFDQFSARTDTLYLSDEDDEALHFEDLKMSSTASDLNDFLTRRLFGTSSNGTSPARRPGSVRGFISIDEDELLAYDSLKRPIKLLHNTGGLLADLEFPDSDISWTPDSLSLVSPVVHRAADQGTEVSFSASVSIRPTRNAGTQT